MIKNIIKIFSFTKVPYKKVIFYELIHSFFIAIPNGVLLFILWELFSEKPDIQKITYMVIFMILALIIQLFFAKKVILMLNNLVYDMTKKLRIMLGNHLQKISLGFYKKRDPGDIGSVIMQDVSNFEMIFSHSIQDLLGGVFGVFFLSLFLLSLDFKLTLILLLAIPISFGIVFIAGFFVRKYGEIHIKSRNSAGSKFIEYIEGIVHLKAFNQTGDTFSSLKNIFLKLKKDSIKVELFPGPFMISAFMVFEFFFLFMLYYAIGGVNASTLSIPYFIAFLIIGYRLYEPMKLVIVQFALLRYMNVSLSRIITLLESPLQSEGNNLIPKNYDIEFKNVEFSYIDKKILDNISFKIPENSMTALVGASGVGKSTIASLIARFWDVQKGSISIGGIDLKDISPSNIYSMISQVFQDVYLFNDTILENIKIGKPDASEREINLVLEKARINEFLGDLENGLETKVGEGGCYLSGGQKQRISIARAMLKDAPIILLDEATASLDPENEIYIQEAIKELIKNKTVIVIAHKLYTVAQADNIIVLGDRNIKESGTHKELLDKKGIYENFWNIQQKISSWQV